MTKELHTPTPWLMGTCGHGNIVHFDGDDIRAVATVPRLADAVLVTEAVNSHATLLAACEAAMTIRELFAAAVDADPGSPEQDRATDRLAEIDVMLLLAVNKAKGITQ